MNLSGNNFITTPLLHIRRITDNNGDEDLTEIAGDGYYPADNDFERQKIVTVSSSKILIEFSNKFVTITTATVIIAIFIVINIIIVIVIK